MSTATYNPPPDRKPYRITKLRIPGWWAFAHSFICANDPAGMVRVLDKKGVTITTDGQTIPLQQFLNDGGKLEDIT